MKRYTKFVALLLIFIGCTQPQLEEPDFVKKPEPVPVPNPLPVVNYFEVFSDQQYETLKGGLANQSIVEYYSAVWCGYCKQQTPIIKELSTKHKNVTFIKIDVDTCKNTPKQAEVKSLPTIIVNGKKFVGLTNSSILEQEILK